MKPLSIQPTYAPTFCQACTTSGDSGDAAFSVGCWCAMPPCHQQQQQSECCGPSAQPRNRCAIDHLLDHFLSHFHRRFSVLPGLEQLAPSPAVSAELCGIWGTWRILDVLLLRSVAQCSDRDAGTQEPASGEPALRLEDSRWVALAHHLTPCTITNTRPDDCLEESMSEELIHDRGRGPEIIGTRITVYNLLPHFLDPAATESRICRLYELTPEQVAAARAYVLTHLETVLADHLKIEERMSAGNDPKVIELAKQTKAQFVAFSRWLAERDRVTAEDQAAVRQVRRQLQGAPSLSHLSRMVRGAGGRNPQGPMTCRECSPT